MKPFGALYFIRENKARAVLLIFMFILSYIAWLGGIYVTNISSVLNEDIGLMDKFALMVPLDNGDGMEKFNKAKEELSEREGVTVLKEGVVSNIYFDSVMDTGINFFTLSFSSVEDFKTYCRVQGISCDFSNLKPGSVILGELAAKNRGMKLGDKLTEKEDERLYGEYTLDAVLDEKGSVVYFIDTGKNGTNNSLILLADGMSEEEFAKLTKDIAEKYSIHVYDRAGIDERLKRQLSSLNYIYVFIVILLAVVMGVTINAAFVGMYQTRQPEFAIYRAIGISKGRIVGKVAGELLIMDLIGIVLGAVILFTGVYLLNNLVLIPGGRMLYYYHPLALFGMLLCNMTVLIPLLITRSRQLLRADVCEY